jgi:hypothetical protein
MTHEEFVQRRLDGTISAGISNSNALRLIEYLPKRYQVAHTFWSWVWMLSIPGFICVSIFYKWWVGVLLLIFVTPLIASSTKKSAAQFVLEHAQDNKDFFNQLVKNNLLVFVENTGDPK